MIVREPVIAERYAKALLQAARKAHVATPLLAEVEELLAVHGIVKLRRMLEGPQISTEAKEELFARVFKGRIHDLLYSLLLLLLRKGRIDRAGDILRQFKQLLELEQGLHEGEVVTARALSVLEQAQVQGALEKRTSRKLRLRFHTDERIIGGVKFLSGELMIDDTVRTKLDRLQHQLTESLRP